MSKLTVSAKGQVTLRKEILEHLGVEPGAKIVVDKLPNGRLEIKAAPSGEIPQMFDVLKTKGASTLSVERIRKLAARGWAGKR